MKLYSYFRSSASYRVRIALALKGLAPDYVPVHLVRNEQMAEGYRGRVPAQLVPALDLSAEETGAGAALLTQSLAIIEYLDETHPEPPLLPADPLGRARARAIAMDIACEIHPLDNLRVLRFLTHELHVSEEDKNRWYRHWVETGLQVVEARLVHEPGSGLFCHGDTPGLADCVLVPQIHNALRMSCRIHHVPTVMAIFERCMALPAFATTAPSACPDAG